MQIQKVNAHVIGHEIGEGKTGAFLKIRTKDNGTFSLFSENNRDDKATAKQRMDFFVATKEKIGQDQIWEIEFLTSGNYQNVNNMKFIGPAPKTPTTSARDYAREDIARSLYACAKIVAATWTPGDVPLPGTVIDKAMKLYEAMEERIDAMAKAKKGAN